MLDTLQTIVGLVVSVTSFLTAIYKKGFKKDVKREQIYYQNILRPFVCAYKKKNNIDSVRFLKNKLEENDEIIPKYICELVKTNNSESLKKVLIYDYCDFYSNDDNHFKKILRIISKGLVYLGLLLSLVVTFGGSLYIARGVLDVVGHLGDIIKNREFTYLINLVIGMVYLVLSVGFIGVMSFYNKDNYTMKRKKINRIIDKKVKVYDDKYNDFVL